MSVVSVTLRVSAHSLHMKRVSVVVFDVFDLLLTVGESRRSVPAGGRLDGAARDGTSQLLALVPPRLAVEGKLVSHS